MSQHRNCTHHCLHVLSISVVHSQHDFNYNPSTPFLNNRILSGVLFLLNADSDLEVPSHKKLSLDQMVILKSSATIISLN